MPQTYIVSSEQFAPDGRFMAGLCILLLYKLGGQVTLTQEELLADGQYSLGMQALPDGGLYLAAVTQERTEELRHETGHA
jgi:hypothetical protein